MRQNCFISVEGLDGAGKSTHLAWLVEYFIQRGLSFVQTREPGGTELGEKLRTLLLNDPMHLDTEALLMFAARNEHLTTVILPALARGDWVLCDRFTDATYAYQCGGRGLDVERFLQLEQWVQYRDGRLIEPDLTLIFDVPLAVSQARMANSRVLDRFEREKSEFHAKVRQAYLQRAADHPQRIQVINADRTITEIQSQLLAIMDEFVG